MFYFCLIAWDLLRVDVYVIQAFYKWFCKHIHHILCLPYDYQDRQLKAFSVNTNLIQNSQAVKKVCGPQKGYGEKRCEIQGGGQEMAVMVG